MFFTMEKNYAVTEKVLSLTVFDNKIIYCGTSKQLKTLDGTILYTATKSLRTVASSKNYFACGSYDCITALFKNMVFVDLIEGPDTEIKSVAFSSDEKYIAIATRGKSVWVCTIGNTIEIDTVLEDHYHDVKGVKFLNNLLFSYGYDNRILVYERLEIDDSWECIHCIEMKNTIWNIDVFNNKKEILIVDNDGNLSIVGFLDGWRPKNVFHVSMCPIYSVVNIGDEKIGFILNLRNIGFIDKSGDLIGVIEDVGFIFCLYWDEFNNELICGGDGFVKIYKL